jgi:L-aminopeptidase/D-esterase-like protein
MAAPGKLNTITDVDGLLVGNSEDSACRTGTTVILTPDRAVCGVLVAGGGPGTRETDALAAENLVDAVDAVVLSGGSMYGLGAGDGVAAWLGAQGRGYVASPRAGVPRAPIVPAAILFDLANGGNKDWKLDPPYRRLGIEAAERAGRQFAMGTAGAGYGATAGRLKGGLGSASLEMDGFTVGAIVAVNSFGSVVAPNTNAFWAAPFEIDDEFGGVGPGTLRAEAGEFSTKGAPAPRENTTIACVATDAILTPAEARRIAQMASAGMARAIRPVFSPFDGDVVFALATGKKALPEARTGVVSRLGAMAADCLARAIARGVYEATAWPDAPIATYKAPLR